MQTLIPLLLDAVGCITDLPLVFLGHSNGAVIAYELARAMQRDAVGELAHIVLSSKPAPHLWKVGEHRHDLDDRELLAELRRIGGTPHELLADRELMLQMLPMLRADFALTERYDFPLTHRLDAPAALWSAREDRIVAAAEVQAWQRYFTREPAWRSFAGGHFYLHQASPAVLDGVLEVLHACARRTPRPLAASPLNRPLN